MTEVTIYHNPRCSKSRQTLSLIQESGVEPNIVEYLKTPLSAAALKRVVGALGIEAKDLLRRKESLFKEVCPEGTPSNAEAIKLMAENPKLMERPIVVVGERAVVGRPPENVRQLLDS